MKPCILFGNKPDYWEKMLPYLDIERFEASFGNLAELDLKPYDYIVPWELTDCEVLLRRLPKHREKAILIDPEVIALCEDKRNFNQKVSSGKHGRMIPSMLDLDAVLAHKNDPTIYPMILKCSQDAYGMNSFVIRGPDDLAAQAERISHPSFFLQNYVMGTREVATHMLMHEGKVVYFSNVVYSMPQAPYVRGAQTDPIEHHIDYDNTYVDELVDILLEIGLRDGTCCFNYKLDSGIPKIFEVNARWGASLVWDVNSYLDAYISAINAERKKAEKSATAPN